MSTQMNNQPYELRGYLVSPRSISSIREAASKVAAVLGLTEPRTNLESFLEKLYAFGITVDVVEDDSYELFFNGVEASCIPETATIFLTEDTYKKALRNDSRTRFTIFHELGHLVLGHNKVLHRGSSGTRIVKPYEDSEWQADQFAAEITMPLNEILTRKLLTAAQLQTHFGVSEAAAYRRFNQLNKKGLI